VLTTVRLVIHCSRSKGYTTEHIKTQLPDTYLATQTFTLWEAAINLKNRLQRRTT